MARAVCSSAPQSGVARRVGVTANCFARNEKEPESQLEAKQLRGERPHKRGRETRALNPADLIGKKNPRERTLVRPRGSDNPCIRTRAL